MSNQDPDDIKFKYSDWSKEYTDKYKDVVFKSINPPSIKEPIHKKARLAIGCFVNFTFIKFPTFVGQGMMYLFENISKVINIQIGLFNVEKVEMARIIMKQKEEINRLTQENAELDEDNWAYNDSIEDMHRVGQMMHDEVVMAYGKDHYLAIRWREAESRAQAKLNINYESANKYLSIRERRELQAKSPIMYPFLRAFGGCKCSGTKKAAKKAARKKSKKG